MLPADIERISGYERAAPSANPSDGLCRPYPLTSPRLSSGTLTIDVTASNPALGGGYAGSGVQRVTFPTLFGATPEDTTAPYQGAYTLGGGYMSL
jgi:hypothetical protein